jgi:hypothetical protein
MKLRQVTVGLSRTYNMGNFESFRIEGAITADLDPDETPLDAAKRIHPMLRAQMKETFVEFKPKRKQESK